MTDEKYIKALLSCGSVRGAAHDLGVSQAAVSKRLKNPTFKAKYTEARAELLQSAVNEMQKAVGAAVGMLSETMNDKQIAAPVRVSAADALLRHYLRYLQAVDFDRRLTALEQQGGEEGV